MSTFDKFAIGETVTVTSPHHCMDGKSGKVVYFGSYTGTFGVEIGGSTYGLWEDELRNPYESRG